MISLMLLFGCAGPVEGVVGAAIDLSATTMTIGGGWPLSSGLSATGCPYSEAAYIEALGYTVPEDLPAAIGILQKVSAFVYDGSSGIPYNNMQVEVFASNIAGVYVLPEAAVLTVDTVQDLCDQGAADAEDCAAYFEDLPTGEFYEQMAMTYAYVSEENPYAPTYMSGVTDNRGVMDFYLFIDCLLGDLSVDVSVGTATAVLDLDVQ